MDEVEGAAQRRLREAIEAAARGDGRALLARGPALAGKTTLLRRGRAEAAARPGSALRVVAASGSVLERELPFAFVEQLSGDMPAFGEPLIALARGLLERWSADGPTLLLLDDLQWADDASLELIGLLARRLAGRPVALVATVRGWPPAAEALAAELTREGVAEVVSLAGEERRAERRAAGAGGAARGDAAAPLGLPPRELVARSLAGLPDDARACAEAAAIMAASAPTVPASGLPAPGLPAADLHAVSALDAVAFAAALDVLVAAELLLVDGGGAARFVRPALAPALADGLAPGRRALLHGRAFERLRERGDVVGAAPHAVAAGLVGDARAVETVAEAAAAALDGAVERALELFAAAIALAEPAPPPALLARAGDALFAAGRPDAALDRYARLLRLALDADLRAETLLRAARAQVYSGRFEEGRASYDDLVAQARERGDGPSVALLLERAHVVWELGGPRAGSEALALESGGASTSDADRALLAAARGAYLLQAGDPSGLAAVERLADRERRRLGGRPADPAASFNAFLLHASCCCMTERFDAGLVAIEHGSATLTAVGAARSAAPLRLIAIGAQLHRGDPRAALRELERVEAELDVDPVMRPYVLMVRARCQLLLGAVEEAAASAGAAAALPAAGSFFVRIWLAWFEAERLHAAGRAAEAAAAYAELLASVVASGLSEPCAVPWAAGAVEAALAAGELALAGEICDWLEEGAAALPCIWPRAVALAGRAGLAAAAGDETLAEERYEEALALSSPAVLDVARVRLRRGAWLRRSKRALAARPQLAEALRVAEERGAVALAAQASAELTAAGGRRRRVREDDGLTPQELRVARLAASGETMREIAVALQISPRTVETHLAHVYLKLGVASKQELRRRRDELGLRESPAV